MSTVFNCHWCKFDAFNEEKTPLKIVNKKKMCYNCQFLDNMLTQEQRTKYKAQLEVWKTQSEMLESLDFGG